MSPLSSRERMLAVLRYEEPDHVPLLFHPFGFQPPPHLAWTNQFEQAQRWLSIGIDAWLTTSPPMPFHPDVKVHDWEETTPGERWPCLVRDYETPAGVLRQEVYRTDDWISPDWPHRDEHVRLFDDHNVSRYRKALVETEEDLDKLPYLFHPPSDEAVSQFRDQAAAVARQAEELGVLLVGAGPTGIDAAIWLCGVEGAVLMAMDRPEMFQALLDIIHERDKRDAELLLDTPVDLVMRRGYYEGASFWSPALFRECFAPCLKELADMVHQADRFLSYTMSVGYVPLLEVLAELGHDAHYLLDPIAGGARVDLGEVKGRFGGRVAIIGGLNEQITLERGTPEEIRQEVMYAVQTLGPGGGLALTPAEGIFASTPWQSIETLIEAWREVREYPLG